MLAALINNAKIRIKVLLGKRIHPFTHFPQTVDIKTFLDIGANKGEYSWSYFRSFPKGRAWLIEPIPKLHDVIRAKLDDHADSYMLFDACLGAGPGIVDLHVTNHIGASSVLPMHDAFVQANPHVKEVEVIRKKLITLDEFVNIESIPPVDLLKVDVEGFELEVISGGKNYLRKGVKWILIEHSFVRSADSQRRFVEVHSLLLDSGFELYAICDQYHHADSHRIVQFDAIYRKRNE